MSKRISKPQEPLRRQAKSRLQVWLWAPTEVSGDARPRMQGVRALRPFASEDHALLKAVHRIEFRRSGIRNRDLQQLLYPTPVKSKLDQRRRSAAIHRKLTLLLAHGLVHKLAGSQRYQVSEEGRLILNAILVKRRATVRQILPVAA